MFFWFSWEYALKRILVDRRTWISLRLRPSARVHLPLKTSFPCTHVCTFCTCPDSCAASFSRALSPCTAHHLFGPCLVHMLKSFVASHCLLWLQSSPRFHNFCVLLGFHVFIFCPQKIVLYIFGASEKRVLKTIRWVGLSKVRAENRASECASGEIQGAGHLACRKILWGATPLRVAFLVWSKRSAKSHPFRPLIFVSLCFSSLHLHLEYTSSNKFQALQLLSFCPCVLLILPSTSRLCESPWASAFPSLVPLSLWASALPYCEDTYFLSAKSA